MVLNVEVFLDNIPNRQLLNVQIDNNVNFYEHHTCHRCVQRDTSEEDIVRLMITGGTSGIGEAFAKRWHSADKRVIVTGRRKERLDELEKAGLQGYVMDNTQLEALPGHVETLFSQSPDIDTVSFMH